MKVTRIRKIARRGGLVGLLLAGLYVGLRQSWRCKPFRLVALTGAVALAAMWLSVDKVAYQGQIPSQDSEATRYEIVDLGTSGEGVVVTSLNSRGDAAGIVILDKKTIHAVVWRNGKMIDLGTLGGALSVASDLNDRGEVVGQSSAGPRSVLGFRTRGRKLEPLKSLNGKLSGASAINSRGQIAGFSTSNSIPLVGCVWQDSRCKALPMLRGYGASIAEDLNDQGQAVGYVMDRDMEVARAVTWKGGRSHDLGTLGGDSSAASAVSNRGHIAGASSISKGDEAPWHSTLWENDRIRDLGKLDGTEWSGAWDVNKDGIVVGASGVG